AKIVPRLERMVAHNLGDGRLKHIDIVCPDIATAVTQIGETTYIEARQITITSEKCRRLRREAETGRVEIAFMLPHVLFKEARETDARVENHCRRESIGMVVAKSVVFTSEEIACRVESVDHTRPVIARLQPVVMCIAEEKFLPIGDSLVEAVAL